MNPTTPDPVTLNLIYPAIVAVSAALLSFYGSFHVVNVSKKKEINDQRITLIDNLILRLNKLTAVLDLLNSDIETRNFFSFPNINKAQKIIQILNGYLWNVHLFEDTQLRTQIVEVVDNADELLNEVNSLESYPLGEVDKAETKRNKINEEFRAIRVKLLSENIVLEKNGLKAKYIKSDSKVNHDIEKLNTVDIVIDNLENELGKANNNIEIITNRNEKHRLLLATKIVDQKTKVRDLLLLLQTVRNT